MSFNPSEILKIDDLRERQKTSIQQFNQAMEERDYNTVAQICEHVIGEETRQAGYGYDWQMHCLKWLTHWYQFQFSETPNDSPEEDQVFERVMGCLWRFKWLVGDLPRDLNASQENIQEANQEMQQWYERYKFSPSMLHKSLMEQNMLMGNVDAVREHYQKWQDNEHDGMNDCPACEQSTKIRYHHFINDYQQVLELAKPILAGELTCAEVPHVCYYYIIHSLIQTNQPERARHLLDHAIEHLDQERQEYIHLIPQLIQLYYPLGDPDTAEELINEYNDDIFAASQTDILTYWQYLLAIIPQNEDALESARDIAKDIDQRNGNSYYQTQLDWLFGEATIH
nr:hypothetical protein [uncultured Kingella sp.]